MKTGTNMVVNTKARRIAFVMVCLLMGSVGLAAKVTLNGLDQMQDVMIEGFMKPSQAHLQNVWRRQKIAVASAKAAIKEQVKAVAFPALPVE